VLKQAPTHMTSAFCNYLHIYKRAELTQSKESIKILMPKNRTFQFCCLKGLSAREKLLIYASAKPKRSPLPPEYIRQPFSMKFFSGLGRSKFLLLAHSQFIKMQCHLTQSC
jgi:hypothetical protein